MQNKTLDEILDAYKELCERLKNERNKGNH